MNLIDQYIAESSVCFKEIELGKKLYRARIIHPATDNDWGYEANTPVGIPCGFNEAGSREPPLGISKEGRNNLPGMSYLYLSSSPETACAEVKPTVTEILSLAEFLVNEPFKIIDFSDNVLINHIDEGKLVDLGQLFMNIMGQYTRPIKNSAEYKATQILTDHIIM